MWVIVLVTGENKVNSYSDQLNLGWICKFGVEFDKSETHICRKTKNPLKEAFKKKIT